MVVNNGFSWFFPWEDVEEVLRLGSDSYTFLSGWCFQLNLLKTAAAGPTTQSLYSSLVGNQGNKRSFFERQSSNFIRKYIGKNRFQSSVPSSSNNISTVRDNRKHTTRSAAEDLIARDLPPRLPGSSMAHGEAGGQLPGSANLKGSRNNDSSWRHWGNLNGNVFMFTT